MKLRSESCFVRVSYTHQRVYIRHTHTRTQNTYTRPHAHMNTAICTEPVGHAGAASAERRCSARQQQELS